MYGKEMGAESRGHGDRGFDYFHYTIPRADLAALIPEGTRRILDVGCGDGKTGPVLKERGFREIVGIELDPRAAEMATRSYDRVIVGNVEEEMLPFPRGYFDCILYGDILEHLVDPWKVLRGHREFLADEGSIVCSIPNIRYYKILKSLVLKGRWDYRPLGILDRTHLRFFTLKTIEDMLRETGFEIRTVVKEGYCSGFIKMVNRLLFNRLIDFLVVQYKIVATKRNQDDS